MPVTVNAQPPGPAPPAPQSETPAVPAAPTISFVTPDENGTLGLGSPTTIALNVEEAVAVAQRGELLRPDRPVQLTHLRALDMRLGVGLDERLDVVEVDSAVDRLQARGECRPPTWSMNWPQVQPHLLPFRSEKMFLPGVVEDAVAGVARGRAASIPCRTGPTPGGRGVAAAVEAARLDGGKPVTGSRRSCG
jgi:hypothetical protein